MNDLAILPRVPFRFLPILLLTTSIAHAEYRVFELEITDSTNGAVRTATTTLDDIQYRFYNPMKPSEKIAIKDTWMCYARSDYFKRLCENRRANRIPAQTPPPAP